MAAQKVCLKAVMTNWEGRNVWTGEYACSICGLRFRPDPSDPAKLSLEFATHKDQHPATTGEIVLERPTLEDLPSQTSNPSFTIRGYQTGDEAAWTHIQTEADRYNTITAELFFREYGNDASEHKRRVLFAVTPSQELVGTSTAWWGSSPEDELGRVHWVAVLPEWQRKGIGRALLVATCLRLGELGHAKAYLTTAPARLEALRLYLSLGFVPKLSNSEDRATWIEVATAIGDLDLKARLAAADGIIHLRPLNRGDATTHLAGEDDQIARWLSGGRSTLSGVDKAIQDWAKQWENGGPRRAFGVFDCATNRQVGFIEVNLDLFAEPGQVNIAYGTFPKWRRKGLALRAIDLVEGYLRTATDAKQMVLRVAPANVASLKLAEKAGFRLVGVFDEPEGRLVRYVRDVRRT